MSVRTGVIHIDVHWHNSVSAHCIADQVGLLAGLVDEVEIEQLLGLVEKKLKRLHFSPPRLPHVSPAAALAAHPLFADVPPDQFHSQVHAYAACPGQALCRDECWWSYTTALLVGLY